MDAASRLLAQAVPKDTPSVVLDEFSYLFQDDPTLERTLQRVWGRWFSQRPGLLVLVGSKLPMMEAIDSVNRPFHQRGVPIVLEPLSPAEVATIGVVANSTAASSPASVPRHLLTRWYMASTVTTVSTTWGNSIDQVPKPKVRADRASTCRASGSLSTVIEAAGSYPPNSHARPRIDMLRTAGA